MFRMVGTADCKASPRGASAPPTDQCIERVSYRAEECVSRFLVAGREIQWLEVRRWPKSSQFGIQQEDRETPLPESRDV